MGVNIHMFAFERHHSEVVILKLYPASKLTWRARQASNTEFLTQQDESKAQENAFLKFPGDIAGSTSLEKRPY